MVSFKLKFDWRVFRDFYDEHFPNVEETTKLEVWDILLGLSLEAPHLPREGEHITIPLCDSLPNELLFNLRERVLLRVDKVIHDCRDVNSKNHSEIEVITYIQVTPELTYSSFYS